LPVSFFAFLFPLSFLDYEFILTVNPRYTHDQSLEIAIPTMGNFLGDIDQTARTDPKGSIAQYYLA